MLLPFWDPQIPPVGISCLKSFLQDRGFGVKAADANVRQEFREILDRYFYALKEFIPANKRRHLYNIGYDVLRNHLMAHLNYTDDREYGELIKILLYQTFFFRDIDDCRVRQLIGIIDDFYTRLKKYIHDLLDRERPAVLGLSVFSGTLAASMFAAGLAKEKFPAIKTIMGGGIFSGELDINTPNFKFFLEKAKNIDRIFVGEGEVLLLKYLNGELPDSQRVFTKACIGSEVVDLAAVDVPDFSDFECEYYTKMANYTSRSCPFQCNFCVETVHWGKFRAKRPGQIVDELIVLYHKYGSQVFLMCDCLLNPVITGVSREFIKRDTALYWGGYLRVDRHVCSADHVFLWRQGGFYRARLGLESGSQSMLDAMGKQNTIEQMKLSVNMLAKAGIKTTTMWVVGYPGETEEDFLQTLNFIEEMADDIYEADCNPFWHFLSGQGNSARWKENSVLLYPRSAQEMLYSQTWELTIPPSRAEKYDRVNRFMEHCQGLGVPNPYSLCDINSADERWKRLHKNAVPPLLEFKIEDHYIDECKRVNNLQSARNTRPHSDDWNF